MGGQHMLLERGQLLGQALEHQAVLLGVFDLSAPTIMRMHGPFHLDAGSQTRRDRRGGQAIRLLPMGDGGPGDDHRIQRRRSSGARKREFAIDGRGASVFPRRF